MVRNKANPKTLGPGFCRRKNHEAANARNINDMLVVLWGQVISP